MTSSFQRDMQRKQQQNQNLSARMPKHEQQRQTATGVDDRYNGGAGASGNTYAQQGVGGYAQQVSSPFPLVSRFKQVAFISPALPGRSSLHPLTSLPHSIFHFLARRDTTIRTRTRNSSTRTPGTAPKLTSSSLRMPECHRTSRTGTLPSGRARTRLCRTAVPLRR